MGFEVSAGAWLLACGIGVVVGLDAVSWPQAMWSRPIVAGTLGGLIFRAPAEGFLVGAWLELVMSRHPPFGSARYPETGPAALLAGAAYAVSGSESLIGLLGAVLVGWTVGWVGLYATGILRRFNARLVADPARYSGNARELARRHRLATRLDGVRAGLIVAALLVPSAIFVRSLGAFGSGDPGGALLPALAAVGLGGLTGSGARALGTPSGRWPVFVAGGLIGVALGWGLA